MSHAPSLVHDTLPRPFFHCEMVNLAFKKCFEDFLFLNRIITFLFLNDFLQLTSNKSIWKRPGKDEGIKVGVDKSNPLASSTNPQLT